MANVVGSSEARDLSRGRFTCIEMQDDVLKFDGNFAIAWSNSLSFAVEKAGKTLIGSAASGEGLVNVYRGTGRVLMAPAAKGPGVPILR